VCTRLNNLEDGEEGGGAVHARKKRSVRGTVMHSLPTKAFEYYFYYLIKFKGHFERVIHKLAMWCCAESCGILSLFAFPVLTEVAAYLRLFLWLHHIGKLCNSRTVSRINYVFLISRTPQLHICIFSCIW